MLPEEWGGQIGKLGLFKYVHDCLFNIRKKVNGAFSNIVFTAL